MPIAGLHTSTTYCQGCINIAPVPYRVGQRICRLGVNDQLLWDLQDPWQRVKTHSGMERKTRSAAGGRGRQLLAPWPMKQRFGAHAGKQPHQQQMVQPALWQCWRGMTPLVRLLSKGHWSGS